MPLGHIKTAGAGGTGGAREPPYFDRSVNPVSTRGTDYAHHITTHTGANFIIVLVKRARANSSKNHTLLMCRI